MLKILSVFGTRPEVIKMAPVVQELQKYPDQIVSQVCITAQHRDMIDPLLDLFEIKADYDLNIMKHNQILEDITVAVLSGVGKIIRSERPDYVIVQGDTMTSMVSALAAFFEKVGIVHVEAGLRTWQKYHPFPEEVNRVMIDAMTDLYCVHSQQAKTNLLNEGVEERKIAMTGNPVVDALKAMSERPINIKGTELEHLPRDKKIILVTSHRKENLGEPLENICQALKDIAQKRDDVHVVYPVHPNPAVRECVFNALDNVNNISLIAPLDYSLFVHLFKQSHIVLTDSGGVQEEASSLNKPVLVLRQVTERPEAMEAGAIKVVGTDKDDIVRETFTLLDDDSVYQRMSHVQNPYGDGTAAKNIVREILARALNR